MSNSSHFDRKYQLVDEVSGEVISNHPYRITKPDGSVIKGISNTQGETELSESAVMAGMKMVLLPKRRGE